MNTHSFTQSDSLLIRHRLARKLHPYRHQQMSALLAAITGFVIEAPFGNPQIVEMSVTPDMVVLVRTEGEVSSLAVARYDELLFAWLTLLNAAKLGSAERIEAESLFAAKIGRFGTMDA